MVRVLSAVVIAITLLAGTEPADAAACVGAGRVAVEVVSPRASVTVDATHDPDDIASRQRSIAGYAASGWSTTGLTVANLKAETEARTLARQLGDGSWCVGLESATLRIGFEDPIRVYVSRRYGPSSCAYRAILEHEDRHVRNYADTLERYVAVLRQRLPAALAPLTAIRNADMDAGRGEIHTALQAVAQAAADHVMADARAADALIDSAASYAEVKAACQDW